MLTSEIKKVIDVWPAISNIVFVPHTEQEYNQIVDLLHGFQTCKQYTPLKVFQW